MCLTSQAHIFFQLLGSADRYHGNEFNITPLLLAYAYCSGLEYICAWKILFFVVPGERQRKTNAQATVSWAADASKHSASKMQDLCWGFAKSKPSFSSSLLMLNAFLTGVLFCSRSGQRYRQNGSCMNVPQVVIIYHMTGGEKDSLSVALKLNLLREE